MYANNKHYAGNKKYDDLMYGGNSN
jgi:hypothetical protein